MDQPNRSTAPANCSTTMMTITNTINARAFHHQGIDLFPANRGMAASIGVTFPEHCIQMLPRGNV